MKTAIILMAYGSPTKIEDIPPYLEEIFRGREVPRNAIEENIKKYSLVNGVSPSNSIIDTLVSRFQDLMKREGDYGVYLGNKHWHPFLNETIEEISKNRVDRIIAIPLFPFPSRNVENSYREPLERSLTEAGVDARVSFINGLCHEEMFLNTWLEILGRCTAKYGPDSSFLFTAHSLPLFDGDESEYEKSFVSFAEKLAEKLNLHPYRTAFQSQGKYGSRWLGPDLKKAFEELKNEGLKRLITVPIGFIYDHIEILYDLDLEFGGWVKDQGYEYFRTELPNYSPSLMLSLRNIVLKEI